RRADAAPLSSHRPAAYNLHKKKTELGFSQGIAYGEIETGAHDTRPNMIALQDQVFLRYREGREILESRLAQADGPAARSRLIADAFRELWPDARFCYCRLTSGDTQAARALDNKGEERPGWAVALEEPIARWLDSPRDGSAGTLPAPPP